MQNPTEQAPDSAGTTPADTGAGGSGSNEADTSGRQESVPADTGQDVDWRARFEHATSERDQLREQFRQLKDADSGLKAKLADALGVAPVAGDDDPAVVIKQLRDEFTAERQRREDLEMRLARERVLSGAADPNRARDVLEGRLAQGALEIDPTDPSSIAAAREMLESDYPEFFKGKSQPAPERKPAPKIPAPKNGEVNGPDWHQKLLVGGRRRI